jgi:hypothetical protein
LRSPFLADGGERRVLRAGYGMVPPVKGTAIAKLALSRIAAASHPLDSRPEPSHFGVVFASPAGMDASMHALGS